MPLTVTIKLNGKVIAGADIANISDLADVSDYLVSAYETASDVTHLPYRGRTFRVRDHQRRQSVWALVERAAAQMKDPTHD
jgi:hypothetical protein